MELDRHGRIREWSIGWLKIEEISKGFSEVGRSNFQIYLRKETQIETTVCASLSSDPLSLSLSISTLIYTSFLLPFYKNTTATFLLVLNYLVKNSKKKNYFLKEKLGFVL